MAEPLPDATAATSRVRFQVLALIGSLSLLTYLDRICISRVQGDIQRELSLSDVEMGFVFSAFIAGYAAFLVPIGWLADLWGPKRIILSIVLWWSLFTALTGTVTNFWPGVALWLPLPGGWMTLSWGFLAMFMTRFLFGCGEAGVYPTLATVVRSWFPASERAMAQGTIFMSARIGATLAPYVIGRLSHQFGWRNAFFTLGAIGVAWSVMFGLLFRNRPEDHPRVSRRELEIIGPTDSPAEQAVARLPWRELLMSPAVWLLSLAYVNIGCAWSFFPTWQPRYLLHVYEVSYADSELWTGLPFLAGAVGSILGGKLSDSLLRRTQNLRWSRTLVGVCGCAAASACILAAGIVETAPQAAVLFALASFCNDLVLAPFWATITDLGGRFTGTLAGWFNMLACIATALYIPAVPWLMDQGLEWRHLPLIMAGLWLIAALAWCCADTSRTLVTVDLQSNKNA